MHGAIAILAPRPLTLLALLLDAEFNIEAFVKEFGFVFQVGGNERVSE